MQPHPTERERVQVWRLDRVVLPQQGAALIAKVVPAQVVHYVEEDVRRGRSRSRSLAEINRLEQEHCTHATGSYSQPPEYSLHGVEWPSYPGAPRGRGHNIMYAGPCDMQVHARIIIS